MIRNEVNKNVHRCYVLYCMGGSCFDASNDSSTCPQKAKGKIIACLCVLIVTCGIATLIYKDVENANDRWNNGICECGGTYELSAASKYRTSESFYYTCNTCGHTEEFSHLMK